jgi:hypothetical protein
MALTAAQKQQRYRDRIKSLPGSLPRSVTGGFVTALPSPLPEVGIDVEASPSPSVTKESSPSPSPEVVTVQEVVLKEPLEVRRAQRKSATHARLGALLDLHDKALDTRISDMLTKWEAEKASKLCPFPAA